MVADLFGWIPVLFIQERVKGLVNLQSEGVEPTFTVLFEATSESGSCPAFEDSAALILLKTPQIVRPRLDNVQLGRRAD